MPTQKRQIINLSKKCNHETENCHSKWVAFVTCASIHSCKPTYSKAKIHNFTHYKSLLFNDSELLLLNAPYRLWLLIITHVRRANWSWNLSEWMERSKNQSGALYVGSWGLFGGYSFDQMSVNDCGRGTVWVLIATRGGKVC